MIVSINLLYNNIPLFLNYVIRKLSWDVALDELKALLRCTAETYTQFKRFNDLVLKKCSEELNNKTDCKFTYESIKRGRTVKAVRFTLEPLARSDDMPRQISIDDFLEIMPPSYDDVYDEEKSRRDKICGGIRGFRVFRIYGRTACTA